MSRLTRVRGPATAGGVLAVIRVVAVPLFFAAERLVDHPARNSGPFDALLALAACYAVAILAAELSGRSPGVSWPLALADLLLISALVASSGGPFSQLRYAFFLLPIGAALLLRPRATAAASVMILLAYAVIALTFADARQVRPDAGGFEVTQLLFLGWMGGAATLLSALLARRAREVAGLAESRGRLVAQALEAEDVARRRLAEALHDHALQNLLAARHELGAGPGAELDVVGEALDRTVAQLREAVFDLHPYLLEQAGLGVALRAVAEQAARRAGFDVDVDVDDDVAGPRSAAVLRRTRARGQRGQARAGHEAVDLRPRAGRRGRAHRGRRRARDRPRGRGARTAQRPHRPRLLGRAGRRRGGQPAARARTRRRRDSRARPPAVGRRPGGALSPADRTTADHRARTGAHGDDRPVPRRGHRGQDRCMPSTVIRPAAAPAPTRDEPLTVLVADDHPLFRRGIARAIERDPGLRLVGEATDGREALGLIAALAPDVAVLDHRMPELSGVEVCAQLRLRPEPATAVLILSAFEDGEIVSAAVASGAAGYIGKTASQAEICAAIECVGTGGISYRARAAAELGDASRTRRRRLRRPHLADEREPW